MIDLLVLYMIVLSLGLWLFKESWTSIINLIFAGIVLLLTALTVLCHSHIITLFLPSSYFLSQYFALDSLNQIFLIILSVLYFGVSIYILSFLSDSKVNVRRKREFIQSLFFFVMSMIGVILSTHLALLWVFIEATTLASTFLIIFEKNKNSLEAGWKYIFICSIGIALAFVGIILLTLGGAENNSLFFRDLYANATHISPFWLKISFVFIVIGFGTKMGLAPVHTWLPDAHSEAPAPISAMLSGTLLNVALLGILRVYKVMQLAGLGLLATNMLYLMGFFSLFVCAVYVMRINNYKRLLAYSSIENMGIAAIGIAVGGLGLYAAMLHICAHSFAKSSFFMTAGNILHGHESKRIDRIRGLLRTDPVNGWLWFFCFISLSGLPPFPIFISEFFIVKAFLASHNILLAVLFLGLTTVIIWGMGSSIIKMIFGTPSRNIIMKKPALFSYLPQVVFLVLLVVMGVYMPTIIHVLLMNAALVLQ